jgi:hypothetical protein
MITINTPIFRIDEHGNTSTLPNKLIHRTFSRLMFRIALECQVEWMCTFPALGST